MTRENSTVGRIVAVVVLLLVLAVVLTPVAIAQSLVSGDVTGTVTDPTGAVVSSATITLKSDATGETRTATSNASGAYRFALLRPGAYTLTVTAPPTFTISSARPAR